MVQQELAERRARVQAANLAPDSVEQAMEQLDEKLLDVRERLAKATEAYRLEYRLEGLQKQLNDRRRDLELAKGEVTRLEGASKVELQNQIGKFNRVYNDTMTTVVADCRSAEIDAQIYLPHINDGEYREHSAKVPKRFLYYLSLLQLSLLSDIPFPRLLLVDTPETAGIDPDSLVKMLRQISTLENPKGRAFQILFSTGVGKYPPEFAENVVLKLSKEARLLTEKEPTAKE